MSILCVGVHMHVSHLGLWGNPHLFPGILQPLSKIRFKPHFTNEKKGAEMSQSWQHQSAHEGEQRRPWSVVQLEFKSRLACPQMCILSPHQKVQC